MEREIKNESIIRQYFEAVNNLDFRSLKELIDINYAPSPRGLLEMQRASSDTSKNRVKTSGTGVENLITRLRSLFESLGDFSTKINRLVSKENEVWVDLDVEGTHTGPLLGVKPTNKRIFYRAFLRYELKNFKIIRSDALFDWLSILTQINALTFNEDDFISQYISTLSEIDFENGEPNTSN